VHHIFALRIRIHHELLIPEPVWLLTIGGQEIREPRSHVPSQVFYQHGDRVCLRIKRNLKIFLPQLCKRPFAHALISAQLPRDFVEVMPSDNFHAKDDNRIEGFEDT
jgi:hypothetical protein